MTRAEIEELIAKPVDALTSNDIQRLQHLAQMRELFGPDYVYTGPTESDAREIYLEITQPDDIVIRRVFIGRGNA